MEQFIQASAMHGHSLVYKTQHSIQDLPHSPLSFLCQVGPRQTYFWNRFEEIRYSQDIDSKYLSSFGIKINKDFRERICTFISSKSDLIFTGKTTSDEFRKANDYETITQDLYADIPPLEVFIGIPTQVKVQHFFKAVKEGDILIGKVAAKKPFGIFIQVMDLELSRKRDLYDCNIQALCRTSDLCQDNVNGREYKDLVNDLKVGDYIRGVVVSLIPEDCRISVSLRSSDLSTKHQNVFLGLIEDFDSGKLRYDIDEDQTYMDCLSSHPGLNNPRNIDTLKEMVGIEAQTSLLRGLQRHVFPREDYFDELRKKQSAKWSMSSVAKGIEYFKSGDKTLAMKYLDHALQIDEQNIEALVAKGALSANEGSYCIAIKLFRQAIAINNKHTNAIKYLVETLLEQGLQQEKTGHLSEAQENFQEILTLKPENTSAQEALTRVKLELKRQKEQKNIAIKEATKSKFSHIRKLIEDEEKHRHKKKKKKDKKKKKQSKKRAHKSKHYDTSSESLTDSDSDEPRASKKRRKSQP